MDKYKILFYKEYDGVYEGWPCGTKIVECDSYGKAASIANNNLDNYGAVCANVEMCF